jgi:hypothetical protein
MGALRDFVADILESQGAAIEPIEPDGLEVLAPESVRAAMGWPEFARLGFGGAAPAGAIPVGLEGDALDRFGALLGERGRFVERQLDLTESLAAPGDAEGLLGRALDLPNAIWRLKETRPGWTRCLLLALRYTAISDEKREGLIWLGFNQGTGAVLDGEILKRLRARLGSALDWRAPDAEARLAAGPAWDGDMVAARAERLVEHHIRRDLGGFLSAMRRRLDRDRGRIHEYHDDLRRTAQMKLAALGAANGEKAEAERRRETLRIAAIEREYAAKLNDLRHNYALRVSVDWMQGLMALVPIVRYDVLIKRRKGERLIQIDWHPGVRMIEPPRSEWGPGVERPRLVCDERLHLTDPCGQDPCSSCGKPFCRACHAASCPRCGPGRREGRLGS